MREINDKTKTRERKTGMGVEKRENGIKIVAGKWVPYGSSISVFFNKKKIKWIKTNVFKIYINTSIKLHYFLKKYSPGTCSGTPVAGVWLCTMTLFFVKYLHVLTTIKTKLLTRCYKKTTPYCTIYLIFLAGAGPEFPYHVIDTVITIPYHYFHKKNTYFGNY